jgi:TPR repeat protein
MRDWIGFLWLSICLTTSAFAEPHVALVVGNSAYGAVGTLPNPAKDAALLADTLKSEGFKATLVQGATAPIAPPTVAALKTPEPTECDRLAAAPFDPDLPKGFPGVLKGGEINPGAAIPACRRALETTPDDRRVRFQLGRALQSGKKFEEAKLEYEQAASTGSASAMNNLGVLYKNGWGVAKDYAQARAWLQKAADQGDADAQYKKGELSLIGGGVAKDYAQAQAWFQKAADQGDATAQNNLGAVYSNGRGVAKDYAQARAWFQKAADQGDADAQNNLGELYMNSQGVAKDYAQARAWFQKAADQGNADAIENLKELPRP